MRKSIAAVPPVRLRAGASPEKMVSTWRRWAVSIFHPHLLLCATCQLQYAARSCSSGDMFPLTHINVGVLQFTVNPRRFTSSWLTNDKQSMKLWLSLAVRSRVPAPLLGGSSWRLTTGNKDGRVHMSERICFLLGLRGWGDPPCLRHDDVHRHLYNKPYNWWHQSADTLCSLDWEEILQFIYDTTEL